MRDRLVWLELEQQDNEERVWFRIGHQESASAALWRDWAKTPSDEEDER